MWRCTCVPRTVYAFLSPFKALFRCAQARHFVIFCWLVVALIRDPGVGTLKGALPYVPAGLSYWALLRMMRSGQWDAHAVLKGMSKKVLRTLPPPADGRLYLIGETTHKIKRGRKHPVGLVTRQSESSPYTFGFGRVVLIASWDGLRIPVAIAPIDPTRKGHQHILFRQMLKDFEPPPWVREGVVVADAGYAANATLKLINHLCIGPTSLPCPAPASLPTGNTCAIWCNISPKSTIVVGPRPSPMGAATITGCLCVEPSCISWAMSRWYYRKNGEILGRNA